jgi:hypothetical protein
MAFFNSKKYLNPRECTDEEGARVKCDGNEFSSVTIQPSFPLVDGSDALANANQIITFYQVNGARSIPFKAFITTYNETWNSDWSQETVYGRSDPIYMFKQNTRQITLAFKLPAASAGEAYENLTKVQRLVQFIYPSYSSVSTGAIPAQTISRSPLVRLNIMGLTQKQLPSTAVRGITENDSSTAPPVPMGFGGDFSWAGTNGLLGAIANLNVNYNLESTDYGVFQPTEVYGMVLPKLIEVNLSFNVIHEFTVGWGDDNDFASKTYPFNVNILEDGFYPDPPDQDATLAGQSGDSGDNLVAAGDAADTPEEQEDMEEEDVEPDQIAASFFSVEARLGRVNERFYRRSERWDAIDHLPEEDTDSPGMALARRRHGRLASKYGQED